MAPPPKKKRGEHHLGALTHSQVNRSSEEGGSLTAIKALSSRSQAALLGFGPDAVAPRLMSELSLLGPGRWGSTAWTRAYLFLARVNFRVTRRSLADQMAQKSAMRFGEIAYLHTRTCWLDDVATTFLRENAGVPCNLVVLGAGFDTRCFRLSLPEQVQCFEVDARGTQMQKKLVLQKAKLVDAHVTFVEVDFAVDSWFDKLRERGYNDSLPTCFLWEGVMMYLPREVAESTFKHVASCGKGSIIAFDYLGPWSNSPEVLKLTSKFREPFQSYMKDDDDLSDLVTGAQLRLLEHLKKDELVDRYLPTHADGRPIGYLDDFGGFALAGCFEAMEAV